jgi:hypothetical protein
MLLRNVSGFQLLHQSLGGVDRLLFAVLLETSQSTVIDCGPEGVFRPRIVDRENEFGIDELPTIHLRR